MRVRVEKPVLHSHKGRREWRQYILMNGRKQDRTAQGRPAKLGPRPFLPIPSEVKLCCVAYLEHLLERALHERVDELGRVGLVLRQQRLVHQTRPLHPLDRQHLRTDTTRVFAGHGQLTLKAHNAGAGIYRFVVYESGLTQSVPPPI